MKVYARQEVVLYDMESLMEQRPTFSKCEKSIVKVLHGL